MLRDRDGRPVGDWFDLHPHETGADVETRWCGRVPPVTSTEQFFVRSHTTAPEIDAGSWRLLVTGDGVQQETVWSLADLRRLTTVTVEAALECTGNGRRLFADQQGTPRPGTQWRFGAIGVARWRGVPLSLLLDHAGVRHDAVEVTAVGLDDRYVVDGVDHGRVRRPLPLTKATDDVLVALEMNGEPLPLDHGFPARLVVPGWVGIASIKWLGELRVTRTHVDSPWTTDYYRMHGEGWDDQDDAARPAPGQERARRVGRPHGRPADVSVPGGPGRARPRSSGSRSAPTAARPGTWPGSAATTGPPAGPVGSCPGRPTSRATTTYACGRPTRPAGPSRTVPPTTTTATSSTPCCAIG